MAQSSLAPGGAASEERLIEPADNYGAGVALLHVGGIDAALEDGVNKEWSVTDAEEPIDSASTAG
jgi:hypothetical protein